MASPNSDPPAAEDVSAGLAEEFWPNEPNEPKAGVGWLVVESAEAVVEVVAGWVVVSGLVSELLRVSAALVVVLAGLCSTTK